MKRLLLSIVLLCALGGGLLSAPTGHAQSDEPIRIGSKNFTENIVLGQMIILMLEDAGFAVEDYTNLGGTSTLRGALLSNQIDVYPEYTATALNNYFTNDRVYIPEDVGRDRGEQFILISSMDAALNDVIWLQPAPGNNTFAIAVTREFADANGISTVADWAAYINGGGTVRFVASEEFMLRSDGLVTFEATYGFQLSDGQKLAIVDATPAMLADALLQGVNEINAALAFSTDGLVGLEEYVVLEDEQNAQPIFNPAPVFRGEVIRAHPEIVGILTPVFLSLTTENLRSLNAQVDLDGGDPAEVAQTYLLENGFLGTEEAEEPGMEATEAPQSEESSTEE